MTIWETIASEAAAESALWDAALRPASKRELDPVFSSLGQQRFALAVETIYEGYLLHYGRSRLFRPPDGDTAVLLGDYLYAHGLVRLARHGDVRAVADLAELISICTQLRAGGVGAPRARRPRPGRLRHGPRLPRRRRLDEARAALRLEGTPDRSGPLPLRSAGAAALERALAAHASRVE